MTHHHEPDRLNGRDAVAAEWVLRLKDSALDDQLLTQWLAWCDADPRNRQAFDAMESVWQVAGRVDMAPVSASGPAAPHEPSARTSGATAGRRQVRRRYWVMGLAAGLSLLAVLPLSNWRAPLPEAAEYADVDTALSTARGDLRLVVLPDGSRADMGGESTLVVKYSRERRLIVAGEGETHFTVRRDKTRPFVVEAGALTVTAVGTAFSVQREHGFVTVLVTEGVVEVATPQLGAPIQLAAGRRLRLGQGELVQSIQPVDVPSVAAWREGRLEFRNEPLRLVVARLNRYSPRKIIIEDPSIEDLRVTATAYTDRIDDWLSSLEAALPVRTQASTRESGAIALVPSRHTPPHAE